jgi:hypothetical protein
MAPSGPIASLPDKKNEGRDQGRHDKHPVLHFETQNREMIDEKMHSFRPAFVQDKRFRGKNILFLYFNGLAPTPGSPILLSFGRAMQAANQDRKLSAGLSDNSLPNSEGS